MSCATAIHLRRMAGEGTGGRDAPPALPRLTVDGHAADGGQRSAALGRPHALSQATYKHAFALACSGLRTGAGFAAQRPAHGGARPLRRAAGASIMIGAKPVVLLGRRRAAPHRFLRDLPRRTTPAHSSDVRQTSTCMAPEPLRTLVQYTLSAAAKAVGKSKSTVHLAIKMGRLSASRTEAGTWLVDASELHRVFGLNVQDRPASDDPERPDERPSTELAVLRSKVDLMEAQMTRMEDQLARERETTDDLRKRLDQEQEERRALQRQIAAPPQQASQTAQERPGETPAASEPPKAAKGFLARVLGL